jgi:cytochrome c peroxidase
MRFAKVFALAALSWMAAMVFVPQFSVDGVDTAVYASNGDRGQHGDRGLDRELRDVLRKAGFTGDIERTFKKRIKQSLGRPFDPQLAELGRLLWFDKIHSLNGDNSCAGCHSPTHGMGDAQPMAIGVQNNNVVGPNRTGPRNQRRTPTVVNTALYPRLMWNSRFESLSGDPFDPSRGFSFPSPEGDARFSAAENARQGVTHLLQAQAHIPPTELIEVAGFTGICPGGVPDPFLGPRFCQFDVQNPFAHALPLPDASGFRNEPIRQVALAALNASPAYRQKFGQVFKEVRKGAPIDFFHFGKAIAEFEFNLVFADAPIDRFARGHENAMNDSEKRGALLFFGKANCASCHRVDGNSNEMFSDFKEHVVGVPQIFPQFGANTGNFIFSGPSENEDFGREERSGDSRDRYAFRTAPLRNLAVSPGFFHNGAFITLEDAIRFHLNVVEGAKNYDPNAAGVPADLAQVGPVIEKSLIDPLLRKPVKLTGSEFSDLVRFVRSGLLDDRVLKSNLCGIIPRKVPSGLTVMEFEGCRER